MRFNVLTIAGTDPTGGAGIQADLKTFSALGVYGASVITSVIAQNTKGIQSIYNLPPDFILSQLESVLSDMRIDAIKIGMLSNYENIFVIADILKKYQISYIILDTVMFSKNGDSLLDNDAVEILCNKLLPLVSLITPNLQEAAILLKKNIAQTEKQMLIQGRDLLEKHCKAVLIKGGHLRGSESPDWLITEKGQWRFTSPRIDTKNTHGTGCTLSSSLAALRPSYNNWQDTIIKAKKYLYGALKKANNLDVGKGIGPVNHFHAWEDYFYLFL
ncbi:Hydroxymethylpyrimidine/phosphomethylpyrimidine kinase [Candidatus Providencia siddallii]|uniref:hydroxymethylpyrimidine kinase n=1 Tax=Candidatus Providencia siddallii TaxID=1715285 RepID=A0A0M6W7R2_9GAMM|nr:Hydroxymethylpyrimidine/phosphomethylpyrimidine kinase [Candidatus Providencia siddallii]